MKYKEADKSKEMMKFKKTLSRDYIIMGIIILISASLLLIYPDKSGSVLNVSKKYLLELIMVLPAVMVIVGLFSVWIPEELVVKYMGKASGIKGILISFILGMLPSGPLYIAFPMAIALRKKGARISNIIIFVSAWACIKLPQELVEVQFLGIKFTLLRLALTIISVIIMGVIIEKIIEFTDKRKIKIEKGF